MKKNKLSNLLKIGVLFFGISLFLLSCEKEEILIEFEQSEIPLHKVKELFNTNFNRATFPNLKNKPLWESAKTYFVNNQQYIEIPFTDITKFNLKKSTSVSIDKLLAFISPDGKPILNVVHYYAQDIQTHFPNFDKILYFDLTNFNGFATLYDLNKNVINSNKYSSGVKSDYEYAVKIKKSNGNNLFYKMPEGCEMNTETIVTESCWFWVYDDGSTEIINCFYDYEYITYETCEGDSGGGGGGTTVLEEEEVEIINELTGKANCTLNKLISSGASNFHNMVTDLFIEFGNNNIGDRDLTFKMSSVLPNNIGGKTQVDSNGDYHILINSNLMSTLSSIEVAAILVHEMAHAFLGKHYNDSNSTFLELYARYINDTGIQNYSHNIMQDQFINRMATVLQNYDNSILSSFDDYKTLASQGVFDLTSSQVQALNNIKVISRKNDTNCN